MPQTGHFWKLEGVVMEVPQPRHIYAALGIITASFVVTMGANAVVMIGS